MASSEGHSTTIDNTSPSSNIESSTPDQGQPIVSQAAANVEMSQMQFISENPSDTTSHPAPTDNPSVPSDPSDQNTFLTTIPTANAEEEASAIGPSNENLSAVKTQSGPSDGPAVLVTLLLTTGARHPYKIDNKYLRRRNIFTDEKADPFSISVYTMKELIWRDWREEWESRPTSPSAIRLIHFGKMLEDKSSLTDCRFQVENPNVVHMTVKPQDVVDEEEAAAKMGKGSGGRRGPNDNELSTGCRCVIL